jgi:hypothetical protein
MRPHYIHAFDDRTGDAAVGHPSTLVRQSFLRIEALSPAPCADTLRGTAHDYSGYADSVCAKRREKQVGRHSDLKYGRQNPTRHERTWSAPRVVQRNMTLRDISSSREGAHARVIALGSR